MSSISAVGSSALLHQPITHAAGNAKPLAQAPITQTPVGNRAPDHDGDVDGPGIDVKG
jgi:hypothetical protein